jgi:outer membrane receptor for ferrienterochelin and colicins
MPAPSRIAASTLALALLVPVGAVAGDRDALVSPETLEALDDLDLLDLPDRAAPPPDATRPPTDHVTELTVEQLAGIQVKVASGLSESLQHAPGTIVVVTALDIRERGYGSIDEIFEDLPGFDVVKGRGTQYVTVYGRGYRTPFTQRILLLIDGRVDNHLWTHEAELTRQYPLSNVARVEILYGPASAVYGPNAFTAIVNVVTRDGGGLAPGQVEQDVTLGAGSWNSRWVDAALRGRSGDFTFALSGRMFASDEPDLSGRWGYLDPAMYGSETTWGPILALETADEPLGRYLDRTDDRGFVGSIGYGKTRLGLIHWERAEGYGAYYAADRVQNNAFWVKGSRQLWVEHVEQPADRLTLQTVLLTRDNTVGGDWIEADPDPAPGMQEYSYVTRTQWLSRSSAVRAEQNLHVVASGNLELSGGVGYARKRLTKQYDIPGYYDAYSSQGTRGDPGPHGLGSHVGHSADETYELPPGPSGTMPSDNIVMTHDLGGFAQAIYDRRRARLSAGVRLDHNSIYGATFNPRVTGIYKLGTAGALKLLYGEAFQEPAPIQLWGGWSGRLANPDLRPEKVRNLEAVALYRTGWLLHGVSAFVAYYEDVIKEEAENAGQRRIAGLQYDARFSVPNPIFAARAINGYANATLTTGRGSQRYDHAAGAWLDGRTRLGDIAPLKANAGVTVPVHRRYLAHLRARFVGERRLYARNPLRDPTRPDGGRTLDPYLVLDAHAAATVGGVRVGLKVRNLLDATYLHPGVESASSGDDFTQRSAGFHNSLLAQEGRSVWLTLTTSTR